MLVELTIEHMENNDFILIHNFIDGAVSNNYLEILKREINWRQDKFKIFGKVLDVPRLTAWYGDNGLKYSYSGLSLIANGWHPKVEEIKNKVESNYHVDFNSVLINYYRDNNDSMGWHSDAEKELGTNPIIGIVSLGETRSLQFKHKRDKSIKSFSLELSNGSLLIMGSDVQHNWLHQIPKSKRILGERISLTFRKIIN